MDDVDTFLKCVALVAVRCPMLKLCHLPDDFTLEFILLRRLSDLFKRGLALFRPPNPFNVCGIVCLRSKTSFWRGVILGKERCITYLAIFHSSWISKSLYIRFLWPKQVSLPSCCYWTRPYYLTVHSCMSCTSAVCIVALLVGTINSTMAEIRDPPCICLCVESGPREAS